MSDFKIPTETLLEVLAFESFIRRDLKRILAYEAEQAHEFSKAAALEAKAVEDHLAGERMLERLGRPVVWKNRFAGEESGDRNVPAP